MHDPNKIRHTLRTVAVTGLAGTLAFSLAGCKSNAGGPQTAAANGGDPAAANLAQPYTGGATGGYTDGQKNGATKVMGQSQTYNPQSSGENYEVQTPAPIIRQAPQSSQTGSAPPEYYPVPQSGGVQTSYNGDPGSQGNASGQNQSQGYTDAEEAGEQALAETDQAPPPLPEYDQPPAPADNYIWNPGYWNYASTGYYFVPGIWCAPPFYSALWTPPYWGYDNHRYLFHRGYWGPHIGYYGGIDYGFGYVGTGYYGGYWRGHDFYYNRAVTNVNVVNVHNVYQRTVVYNNQTYGPHPINRVSYNGGSGGLHVQPRPEEIAAMHEAHYAPLPAQRENRLAAANDHAQFFSANRGRPAQAFVSRPVGTVNNIATTPREQAFNHGGSVAPALVGRPGNPDRPEPAVPSTFANERGGVPNSSALNNNRPGGLEQRETSNQPGFNGGSRDGFNSRPGVPNQPVHNNTRSGDFNRPLIPNQSQTDSGRSSYYNRPGTPNQPAFNNGRPASNQPNTLTQPPVPAYTRPITPTQPAHTRPENLNRPGGSVQQPTFNNERPTDLGRSPSPNQPGVIRPRATYARPASQPQPAPAAPSYSGSERQRSYQPEAQPQGRPNFANQPSTPQAEPQNRPYPREQQAAPSFTPPRPQPQPSAPHTSAPVAPHAEAPQPHSAPAANPHPH